MTLKSIIDNLTPEESSECLIIIFIAEVEKDFVASVANEIKTSFGEHVESGLIEVISPPQEFYPDLTDLRYKKEEPRRTLLNAIKARYLEHVQFIQKRDQN